MSDTKYFASEDDSRDNTANLEGCVDDYDAEPPFVLSEYEDVVEVLSEAIANHVVKQLTPLVITLFIVMSIVIMTVFVLGYTVGAGYFN